MYEENIWECKQLKECQNSAYALFIFRFVLTFDVFDSLFRSFAICIIFFLKKQNQIAQEYFFNKICNCEVSKFKKKSNEAQLQ